MLPLVACLEVILLLVLVLLTSARECVDVGVVGSAVAARGCAVATGAPARKCAAAEVWITASRESKADDVVVGMIDVVVRSAFATKFAFAFEMVVRTEGSSRRCEEFDVVLVGTEGASRVCEALFDMAWVGIEGSSRRCEDVDVVVVGFALAAR